MKSLMSQVTNISTSPKTLREIYESNDDQEIHRKLTKNPNTPLDILLKLGEFYPAEFLANPALDLYLLSKPNFLMEILENTFVSILKLPQVPHYFIDFALKHRRTPNILAKIIVYHPSEKIDLIGVNLRGVNLVGADLTGVNLTNASLIDINLWGVKLNGANLSKANLTDAYLMNAEFNKANLTGAKLNNTNSRGASFKKANLQRASLRGADLIDVNLTNADLRGADLRGANLNTYHIWSPSADLRGADLRGADLRGTDLKKINLSDVLINEETKMDYDVINKMQIL